MPTDEPFLKGEDTSLAFEHIVGGQTVFSPGITFRSKPPGANMENTSSASFLWIRMGLQNYYIEQMQMALEPYNKEIDLNSVAHADCSDRTTTRDMQSIALIKEKVCHFNNESFRPCTLADDYGFKSNSPCILLRLNNIWSWKPKAFDEDGSRFEKPAELNAYLSKNNLEYDATRIYFICKGRYPVDEEILGEITIHPPDGVPTYFYPYSTKAHYVPPAVMARFSNIRPNTMAMVRCDAYGGNVVPSNAEPKGASTLLFEIMVEQGK